MTTVWPICLPTCSNTSRATMSMALPGVSGTMTRIGCRVGQACACDGAGAKAKKAREKGGEDAGGEESGHGSQS
jgi:hypothetical protein